MSGIGEMLRITWAKAGIGLRSAASGEALAGFQGTYGVSLSEQLLDYFRTVDGMPAGEHDDGLLSFLPLHQVHPITDRLESLSARFGGITKALPQPHRCFVFVEHIRRTHIYAVRLSCDTRVRDPVFWICGSDYHILANSSGEFFRRYLTNRSSIDMPVTLKTRLLHYR